MKNSNKFAFILIVLITIAIIEIPNILFAAESFPAPDAGGRGGMGGIGGGMGRGMRMGQRPAKAERLASVKELEKQISALKAAIEKAPDKDPNIATLENANLTKFMDVYTTESDAINTILKTLSSLSGTGAGSGGRGSMGSGLTSAVISELLNLAKQEKAAKLTSRLEALSKEAQAPAARGGGMMGGQRGGNYTPPEGGFKYND